MTCLHASCTVVMSFRSSDVSSPRIGTGSEVGLCVDAAKKLDKKAKRGNHMNHTHEHRM